MVVTPQDSDPRMTALARTSSKCKLQTHALVREDVTLRTITPSANLKKILVVGLKGLGVKTN
jgi:hypothetical protein